MNEELFNRIMASLAEEVKKENAKEKEDVKESDCKCDSCNEKCNEEHETFEIPYNVYENPKALLFAFQTPVSKEVITIEHKLNMIRVSTAAETKNVGNLVSDINIPALEMDGEVIVEIPDVYDTNKTSATFANGILWVTIPRSKSSVARTIEIK